MICISLMVRFKNEMPRPGPGPGNVPSVTDLFSSFSCTYIAFVPSRVHPPSSSLYTPQKKVPLLLDAPSGLREALVVRIWGDWCWSCSSLSTSPMACLHRVGLCMKLYHDTVGRKLYKWQIHSSKCDLIIHLQSSCVMSNPQTKSPAPRP